MQCMNATLSIRRAELADLPTVIALAHDIWHRHYPGIITREQIDYMLARGYSPEALAPFVTDPTRGLALAERAAQPLGFAAWYPPGEPGAMKLDKLYVLPQTQGQGIGRALIEHVAAAARRAGCRTLTLNVNRYNAGAIRAYERCGFRIARSGDFDIGNGFVMEDYIMERPLE
jgi:ribosomal protein S18 acetylase RimI-like enzyme